MQLKKFSHIILILLLLVSTAGVTINKHYSGGDLFSTALFVEADSCCEIPCGCCDESSDTFKIEAEYLASTFELSEVAQFELLFISLTALMQSAQTSASTSSKLIGDFSPPPSPDLCVINQVFRL